MAGSGNIRQPLIVSVGHVDAGKTSLLDRIRGTAVSAREAGGITQCIGCSYVPLSTIKAICGNLLSSLKTGFSIPGLLFIDTPGHAAFTNLRKRGGNLADIAILVVDINEGFKEQTFEAIDILKSFKTPFVVAANKVDLVPGWRVSRDLLLNGIESQADGVREKLDTRLYEIVGKLSELGFQSERFDRVDDYSRQVAIIPCSAKSGEGIPELLMVISGLAQKFLEQSLKINVSGSAKGTVLEVKKDRGLGTTLDVIIYDGVLKKGDTIVVGTLDVPVVTKVKALFEPAPLSEMRDKAKFMPVDDVAAASGVKVSALNVESVVAGAPLRSCSEADVDLVKSEIMSDVSEVLIETDQEGVVVKADTLGSLEALLRLLRERGILVKRASIGDLTRKDFLSAEANVERSPLNAAVLGFNVSAGDVVSSRNVSVFTNQVIYRLIEEFEAWQAEVKSSLESRQLDVLVRPCKFKVLPGYVFRQSNPAIVGVEVLAGVLHTGMPILKGGRTIGTVKAIQLEQENITTAEQGKQVAVSIDSVTVGRQVNEGDELLSSIPEEDFRNLKKLSRYLSREEIAVLREIAEVMRADNPMWGI
ncbi:translation initiation factor IF-2 [Candidatus Woesearchaeota archaeon]|nr:translation initiation factor IF-2 [Candidatus Woesearchaeota archaeon]